MTAPANFQRIRTVSFETVAINLPPQILMGARIAARAAGISVEDFIADIVSDAVAPVFAGRELAAADGEAA